jgi:hypothetical protein
MFVHSSAPPCFELLPHRLLECSNHKRLLKAIAKLKQLAILLILFLALLKKKRLWTPVFTGVTK